MRARRPYERSGIGQLETLFAMSRNHPAILRELADELGHRKVPRADDLLDKVRQQMQSQLAATGRQDEVPAFVQPATVHAPTSTPVQITADRVRAAEVRLTLKPTRPSAPAVVPVAAATPNVAADPHRVITTAHKAVLSNEGVEAMSVESARKILGVTALTPSTLVEAARRQQVEQAHPAKLLGLPIQKVETLQIQARLANAAFACLLAASVSSSN